MTEGNTIHIAIDKGFEGIIACSSSISTTDRTRLLYREYTIEDQAEHFSFEETIPFRSLAWNLLGGIHGD